jgi:hypothetical protein
MSILGLMLGKLLNAEAGIEVTNSTIRQIIDANVLKKEGKFMAQRN